ncbi:type VI secretion system Vgr family protein [Paraburkholderia caribensis]|uniref:type VI secretion system Vgr family protein n=1 Tax=Paraburkholderia caribensis TaxID=75105 RepID=UPI0007C85C1D|nr:type VI secretion system tip protein VgrG [Paraburkholderia caribensis]
MKREMIEAGSVTLGELLNSKSQTGRQAYFLDVPGTASASQLSVVSFEAVEKLGEPWRVTIRLTHPEGLLRADYLGKDAVFSIVPVDGDRRTFSGWLTHFTKLKTTHDFSSYEMVVEAHFAKLKQVRASRIFQHQNAPEIIESILREHGFKGHQFSFTLRRQYPQHAFRFAYQTDDLSYVQMLMQKEGIFCHIDEGEHGDVLNFCDDVDHYIYTPALHVPYRETSGLEAGVEALFSLRTAARTVAQSVTVADYNPDQAFERFKAEANVSRDDKTTYGPQYIWGTHHQDGNGAQWEAQLRHEVEVAWQVVYEGESNVVGLRPARVLHTDEVLPDAPNGQVIIAVSHRGSRDEAYTNSYEAIPADRRFRLKCDEAGWPKITGTLSARVTSPGQYKYAYLTQQGYYVVRFDLDFSTWSPGGESVPLRLAKPFAGALQTGFHFPLIDGTEVAVAFHDGNPDRPYIAHALHNSQSTDHVTSDDRWLSRNVIRTQSNNKLRMEDWQGQEGVKLATEYGKTQLNMGFLVDRNRQQRGDGYELRTDDWGVLRAGKGIFISADAQSKAEGQALDMQQAQQQLSTAQARMRSLSDAVTQAKAVVAACEEQQDLLERRIRHLQQAVILASAPHGMAFTSGEHMQIAAGGHLFATAGGNADTAVGGNYTVAAGNAVSLYANAQGMKLYSGKGKLEMQAQSDALELTALKGVSISSTQDTVTLNASKSLMLMCGGSYIRLEGSQVEIGSAGEITLKGPLRIGGSATQQAALPVLPTQQDTGLQLWHTYPNGEPVKNAKYKIVFPDGSSRAGRLDADGKATVANVPRGGGRVQYFEEDGSFESRSRRFTDPDGRPQTMTRGDTRALPSMTAQALSAAPALAGTVAGGGIDGAIKAGRGTGADVLAQVAGAAMHSAGVSADVAGPLVSAAATAAMGGSAAASQATPGALAAQVDHAVGQPSAMQSAGPVEVHGQSPVSLARTVR